MEREIDLEAVKGQILFIQREIVDAKALLNQLIAQLQELETPVCKHKTGVFRYYRENGRQYCPICKADL